MPYISEKYRLSPSQDRRRKLTDEDKQDIKEMYATGKFSLKQLAELFGVCKKTVLLLVNPDSAAKAKQYAKEHQDLYRQPREKRNASARDTRRYKQMLYLNGELQTKSDNLDMERSE